MTRRDIRASHWTPDIKVPANSLWLPVASDRPLEELGHDAAINILGAGPPDAELENFARIIRDGTTGARERGAMRGGLIFFPDYHRLPPIATIDISGGHSRQPGEPSTLEFYRDRLGAQTAETDGPVGVSDLQLPAGPAVRIHRRFWPRQGLFPVRSLWEEVIFAVRPPYILDTVLVSIGWVEFDFSEALIKAADAMAPTLRIDITSA